MSENIENGLLDLSLRFAVEEDAPLLFGWRNRPDIISLGLSGRAVCWDEHVLWFSETLGGKERKLFIVEFDSHPIGQVRFDRLDHYSAEVSIYLLPEYTGRGWGRWVLDEGCRHIANDRWVDEVRARIRSDNPASLRAFRKAGFSTMAGLDEDVVLMKRRLVQIPHNRLTFGDEEVDSVAAVIRSGQWASGSQVVLLENKLAEMFDVGHAVCVGSGLGALRLAIKALGGSQDVVVGVPAYSCVALANAVLSCGARLVTFDVRANSWNLDQVQACCVEPVVNSNILIAVNTFGLPADIDKLVASGKSVIEDCSHGFKIDSKGRPLMGCARVAVFSFYATKLIGAGEGGAVLTNDAAVASFVRSWRDYSDKEPDGSRLNDKMNDIEASLALCQLRRLSKTLVRRQQLADRYYEYLGTSRVLQGRVVLPELNYGRVWYRYAVELASVGAAEVVELLARRGVRAEQPVTDWRPKFSPGCPNADRAYRNLISLPLYPRLTEAEQDAVIDAFISVIAEVSL